ncbi:cyclic nucleotide-binding domain-containing protein [Leptospira kmetyi]|uniref:Cyclic nucleotide-binding domain-containing protein n=1 Tax=Leptospira kmetyi TaxID=408139 RepID=A0A2M9XL70_9LEPT|nr:cyclic nucleotide-binding domain-containing protein [Leptospira kmetyi]AYV55118.1 cyclic nucleotide-binding domain-containing protein [Leptospira kmetyi]EQA52743.1 cyclic nucleotide-binding domain protein [Leptospira kmetyi serovar Malaysia str. Bejo-Iso9]PJZ30281.1 cAMP-binding protein [Leptospira kmetyi]PJZ40057.1 cAMP-binding protein [Leptospira kmetyi]TGK19473.1 cyclic nucleotide-binding domain-containing protein [Leptospira kmetyi]
MKALDLPIWRKLFNRKEASNKEIIHFLRETSVFGRMKKRTLIEIARMVHVREYQEGETIFRQGEVGAGFYLVYEGSVVIRSVRDGIELDLAHLDAHAFFGELSLFTEERRTASAIALEQTTLLGFFQPDLKEIIETKPRIGIEILMSLSTVIVERLHRTNGLLEKAYFRGKQKNA